MLSDLGVFQLDRTAQRFDAQLWGFRWHRWTNLLLKAQGGGARGHVLDDVGGGNDFGAGNEVRLANTTWLGAGSACPELTAVVQELPDHVLVWRKAFLVDVVRVAIGRQPYAFRREQHHRFLISRCRRRTAASRARRPRCRGLRL